jgi:hypothetical protein
MKKYFLILAFAIVLYGISPAWFARTFLGVNELGVNFAHILRAVMCLYLGLGLFWLCAAFSDKHKNTAILTTIIFAGGLVTGRIVSFFADGPPSPLLIFCGVLEITLVPIAYWIFTQPEDQLGSIGRQNP